MASEREFPIVCGYDKSIDPHPRTIPWSVAEKAWSVYFARHGGDQSLDALAARGGFHPSEMDMFVPGWRDEAGEITRLRDHIQQLTAQLAQADARERRAYDAGWWDAYGVSQDEAFAAYQQQRPQERS